jgi:hypothetical protein
VYPLLQQVYEIGLRWKRANCVSEYCRPDAGRAATSNFAMSYPNVANVTNSPQSFFLLGGRNREHMVTSSIVFLFPNLDNWPGCVALDLDRGAIDQDAAQSQRAGRANAIGVAI